VFYYRRVRKMGFLEFLIFIFVIFTVGHFIIAWSVYLERKFELVSGLHYFTSTDKFIDVRHLRPVSYYRCDLLYFVLFCARRVKNWLVFGLKIKINIVVRETSEYTVTIVHVWKRGR
jgi:hypothetical protein